MSLSDRQRRVLELLAAGHSHDQILVATPGLTYLEIAKAVQLALDVVDRIHSAGPKGPDGLNPGDLLLFERLREWRRERAWERQVPAYMIVLDKTLVALAWGRPTTEADLRATWGIGPKTMETYGAELLEILKREERAA